MTFETKHTRHEQPPKARLLLSVILTALVAAMSGSCVERITIYESDSLSGETDAGPTPSDAGSVPDPNEDGGANESDASSPPDPEPDPEPTVPPPDTDGGAEESTGCLDCPCAESQRCDEGLVCAADDTCVGTEWASPDPVSDHALIWDEGLWQ